MISSGWVKSVLERAARLRGWRDYAACAAVTWVATWVLLRLWEADLRVPFNYGGDALAFGLVTKSVVDHGWYLTNPHLGAPGVLETHDFPFFDIFHILAWKVASWFTSDWALIFNGYFLLGFPLVALTAFAVLRHFRVAAGPALVASVLYAFLPSRLLKGEAHYFLDINYQVPLVVLVALWVCGDDPPLVALPDGARATGAEELACARRRRRRRSWVAVAICVLTAGTGLYYAFFGGVLISAAGVWSALQRRTLRPALAGLALSGIIVAGLAVQAVPTLIHDLRQGDGPNLGVASRMHHESEILGMRLAQLVLPVPGHRVAALREIRARYDTSAPFHGESSTTALGLVASVGFLVLIVLVLLGARGERARDDVLRPLSVLNLMAVLLATMGGLGSILALLVTPQIRSYCRMSVVIAFMALFAAAILLERWGRRLGRMAPLAFAGVAVIGLLDQATPGSVRPYHDTAVRYRQDADLVREIERALPRDAMVFQLPYAEFPEGGRVPGRRIGDYDMLQPYFHSKTLRWSYPTMLGRTGDAWDRRVSLLPAPQLIASLVDAGFGGILINRRGFPGSGSAASELERELERELGAAPRVTDDGWFAFFELAEKTRRLHAGLSADEIDRRRDLALHPPLLRFRSGCFGTEYERTVAFRWCAAAGEIEIDNDARVAQTAALTMTLASGKPPARLTIDGDLLSETVEIHPGGTPLAHRLTIAPGHHRLRYHAAGAPPSDAPGDPRRLQLIWRAENPRLEETGAD